MRGGVGSRAGRLDLRAGVIAVLLVTVAAGSIAIVHYASVGRSSLGGALSAGAGSVPVAGTHSAGTHSAGKAALGRHTQPATSRNGATSPTHAAVRGGSAALAPKAAAVVAAPAFFGTLPPSAKLPSGAQCARWVRARPTRENKGVNRAFNRRTGQHVGRSFFAGDTPQANRLIAPRINGDFTGTTSEILRWTACKWGINQNIVFAQAAVESWWRQITLGDFGSDPNACPPGHGLGRDGKPGLCPQSYGILQNRYPFEKASWPGIGRSTAMNADTAYAIWRTCYDGYETWLNTVQHVGTYRAGDVWGCVGRWFAGRWHTGPAQQYIAKVKLYLRERIWTTPDFQQP
jgi:hypothetical protein